MEINFNYRSNPNAIIEISVEKLFGRYTYKVPDPLKEYGDLSKLIILYGDNGSGKTTILKLLYNILSTADNRGHRSFLSMQKFGGITVKLANGYSLSASRNGSSLIGTYELCISKDSEVIDKMEIEADGEHPVKLTVEKKDRLNKILSIIAELNIDLFFLSDDRKILGIAEEEEEGPTHYVIETGEGKFYKKTIRTQAPRGLPLEPAIERVVRLIRQQAIRASSKGEADANTIYTDVINRIARFPNVETKADLIEINNLLKMLDILSERNKVFSNLGLTSYLDINEIKNKLNTAPNTTKALIYNILKPYIDGIKARLDALEEIKELINILINNINTHFFIDKKVNFDLSQGLYITSDQGELLNPNILSSGEKQLLLLFCNTLAGMKKSSIFIIDEPEISLNVKWQRQLIQALLDLAQGSDVQFILATHSIELLTLHKNNVLRLVNLD